MKQLAAAQLEEHALTGASLDLRPGLPGGSEKAARREQLSHASASAGLTSVVLPSGLVSAEQTTGGYI